MNTFIGLGRDYVEDYYNKTGHAVYLHIKRLKRKVIIIIILLSNQILYAECLNCCINEQIT